MTNQNFMGNVDINDVMDGRNISEEEMKKKFKVGDSVLAKIKLINYQSIKVSFTLRQNDLESHINYLNNSNLLS